MKTIILFAIKIFTLLKTLLKIVEKRIMETIIGGTVAWKGMWFPCKST